MNQKKHDEIVIPLIEEELAADRRSVARGGVRVQKHVSKSVRRIDVPVLHDEVDVQRIPVNREVTEIPRARKEGEVTIIPVIEEEVIVTKRIVLKEEIRITKRRIKRHSVKEVEVEREAAEVQRLDEHGRVLDKNGPE